MLPFVLLALICPQQLTPDPDRDRDGLSDFAEQHKYFTDPAKADTDGDGTPDGDWDERREYAYTVHAVMHVMAPFNVAAMNDDYQDVRVLDQRPDLLEFEVVVYPFNTVADAIEPNAKWRKPPANVAKLLQPGVCNNWDDKMRAQLERELAADDIDLAKLDDVAAVERMSQWLMKRAEFEDGFTTFAVEFVDGKPRVCEGQRANVDETCKRFGRTLQQQWDRELFGKGMFENKIRGSCTSSAIYLATCLEAAGIPARSVVCIPLVDANDDREVAWIDARLSHVGVRATVKQVAMEQHNTWSSHTFNEVLVGGRWRRLNYTKLGQNVLDAQYLGLMVHVHTFDDHSEAGLAGWGNREVHPLHKSLFGYANPYSCVSLSDRFGAHAKVSNEPLSAMRELTINRIYWYDDSKKAAKLTTELLDVGSAGYFFAHVSTDINPLGGSAAFGTFYAGVGRKFALRAKGHDDVACEAIGKVWIDSDLDLIEFILRIEPDAFARMDPGVSYQLAWTGGGEDALRWKVRDGVAIERAKR